MRFLSDQCKVAKQSSSSQPLNLVLLPFCSKFFKTKDEIESEMLEREIRNCVLEIIKKRGEKVISGEEDSFGSDFLGVLIKAHHDADEKQRISEDDLVDECKTFYLVGQETTNVLLSWTVLLLAVHTDWQEEARKEVLNLFGQENPNPDGISKLKIVKSQSQTRKDTKFFLSCDIRN